MVDGEVIKWRKGRHGALAELAGGCGLSAVGDGGCRTGWGGRMQPHVEEAPRGGLWLSQGQRVLSSRRWALVGRHVRFETDSLLLGRRDRPDMGVAPVASCTAWGWQTLCERAC